MKWLKDTIVDIRTVLLAPITNILCVAGLIFIMASFVDYDKASGLSLHGQFHWPLAVAGFTVVALGVGLFYLTNSDSGTRTRLNYDKGVEIRRGQLTILLKKGEIQSLPHLSQNGAIILPANTTFVDDCATDKRTAMGAFFLDRFPKKVAELPVLFAGILAASGLYPDESGQFTPGTTIILPDDYAKPAKVVITASTLRMAGTGITSNPQVICNCMEAILKCTADQRVDTIYLPILGSGHGGVDRAIALLFLILAVLHFSRTYHHIKLVHIIVHPKDIESLNQSKELSQIVAL